MPQTNNIITPVDRLKIAAQLLAGMQAPGYVAETREEMYKLRDSAIVQTDELIKQSGCIVEGDEIAQPDYEEEDAVPCMHERISKLDSTGSHCLDCGEEF